MNANMLEQSYTGKNETQHLVNEVIDASFESVVSTMGPNNQLALIIEKNKPVVTRDGVRVAKALDFNEIRKNMIASLITSAAIKTDELVGDGTTTTVFMVNKLYYKFKDYLNFTSTRYIDHLVKLTKAHLASMVSEVTPQDENFKRMIYTTANYQDSIAEKVIQLFQDYKTPKVQLRRAIGQPEDVIEIEKDVIFEGRYASPHLQPSSPQGVFEIDSASVLILDGQVSSVTQHHIRMIAEYCLHTKRRVIIFSRSFEPDVLNTFIMLNNHINQKQGLEENNYKLWVIPFVLNVAGTAGGNVLKDLSRVIGTNVFSNFPVEEEFAGIFDTVSGQLTLSMKGVKFDLENQTYQSRIKTILEELEPVLDSMTITERANIFGKLLQNRIGRLRAENVIITVSGLTDAEISERLYLYEDAVRVAETSLHFGVIPGIGYGYNSVAEMLMETIVSPLKAKNETNEGLTPKELSECDLAEMFCEVLVSQYEYLVERQYTFNSPNLYLDLVRGEWDEVPEYVFDNGCAAICAIEAGWSVVKRLSKLSVILGKSNMSYAV